MKILFMAGSLRAGSYNKLYVKTALQLTKKVKDTDCQFVDLNDYPMPVFNQDLESKDFPESVKQLAKLIAEAQAVVISSPENNGSIAAVTKNMVDWVSRVPGAQPWAGKHLLLLGASPGGLGAVRGLWHTRIPFEVLGCFVFPEMSGLPKAHEAFDGAGDLRDALTREKLSGLVTRFVKHASGGPQ